MFLRGSVLPSFISTFSPEITLSPTFRDLGDSFNFDRSMRAWHPMPNTQCPNDQKSFADFCYGGMTSCKEGNSLACSKTASSRWIN